MWRHARRPFQNAAAATEASAEQTFVLAAAALSEKQQNLATAVRAQQSTENDVKTKNQAVTKAQAALDTEKAKAARKALPAPPNLCNNDLYFVSHLSAVDIKTLSDAIQANPSNRGYLIARGKAYLGAGLPLAAEADFREILTSNPGDIEALVGWARAAEDQHCWRTAIGRYNQAVTAAERTVQPLYLHCAAMGRARSHIQLATGADDCGSEATSDGDQPLLHCETAVLDFTQAIRHAPSQIDLAGAQNWITYAQNWQKQQSNLKAKTAAH